MFKHLLFICIGILIAVQSNAATLYVTDFSDNYSSQSLRGAISAARSGDQVIIKGNGRITLTRGQITIYNKSLTIRATGDVTIDANYNSRIFNLYSNAFRVITLKNLDLVNGKVINNRGGAILATSVNTNKRSVLNIEDCNFTNNRSESATSPFLTGGGAIYSDFALDIDNTDFIFNRSTNGAGAVAFSSAIPDAGVRNGGNLYITNSDFVANHSANIGALDIGANSGYASLSGVEFRNNFAQTIGAVSFTGRELYGHSIKFNNNRSNMGLAGGLYLAESLSSGSVDIINSEFNQNTAQTHGGAIAVDRMNRVAVKNSSFGYNTSQSNGGAIYISASTDSGSITLENNTLSGNSAERGAAIYKALGSTSSLLLHHVTIANNIARQLGGGMYSYNTFPRNIQLWNSILSNNTPDNCRGELNLIADNIIPDTSGCLVKTSSDISSHLINVDPELKPFSYNGADTRTHAIDVGSSAINAGTIDCDLSLDQRYQERGILCDIGAYEYKTRLF